MCLVYMKSYPTLLDTTWISLWHLIIIWFALRAQLFAVSELQIFLSHHIAEHGEKSFLQLVDV